MTTTRRSRSNVEIGPSILAARFLNLGADLDVIAEAGADYVHVDVMDGRFVPNISIGLPVLEAVRKGTRLRIDVHLMIVEPERWIDRFAAAGADSITVHLEATPHIHRLVEAIREAGARACVAINPGTPVDGLIDVLAHVDAVLVMSVNPGFGGQAFIPQTVKKILRLVKLREVENTGCVIQVDGGMTAESIGSIVAAGATSIVAGTSVFHGDRSVRENIQLLRERALGQ